MWEEIGLTRAECYIANVVKCRPPNNRDPAPERDRGVPAVSRRADLPHRPLGHRHAGQLLHQAPAPDDAGHPRTAGPGLRAGPGPPRPDVPSRLRAAGGRGGHGRDAGRPRPGEAPRGGGPGVTWPVERTTRLAGRHEGAGRAAGRACAAPATSCSWWATSGRARRSSPRASRPHSGCEGPVTSPTFALVRHYRCGAGSPVGGLIHADVYRTGSVDEIADLALAELVEEDAVAARRVGRPGRARAGARARSRSRSPSPTRSGRPSGAPCRSTGRGRWAERADEVAAVLAARPGAAGAVSGLVPSAPFARRGDRDGDRDRGGGGADAGGRPGRVRADGPAPPRRDADARPRAPAGAGRPDPGRPRSRGGGRRAGALHRPARGRRRRQGPGPVARHRRRRRHQPGHPHGGCRPAAGTAGLVLACVDARGGRRCSRPCARSVRCGRGRGGADRRRPCSRPWTWRSRSTAWAGAAVLAVGDGAERYRAVLEPVPGVAGHGARTGVPAPGGPPRPRPGPHRGGRIASRAGSRRSPLHARGGRNEQLRTGGAGLSRWRRDVAHREAQAPGPAAAAAHREPGVPRAVVARGLQLRAGAAQGPALPGRLGRRRDGGLHRVHDRRRRGAHDDHRHRARLPAHRRGHDDDRRRHPHAARRRGSSTSRSRWRPTTSRPRRCTAASGSPRSACARTTTR